jgi:hypothetical protein
MKQCLGIYGITHRIEDEESDDPEPPFIMNGEEMEESSGRFGGAVYTVAKLNLDGCTLEKF